MKVPDHLEVELFPIQETGLDIVLQSSFSKEIRGSNFKNQALFFVDSKQRIWLWKKIPIFALIREYLASILASELGILVPKSIIAKKGQSIGLIQEWVHSAKDLASFSEDHPTLTRTELLDLFVFEAWIGALDRHGGNYLASTEGKIWAIDFEDSFYESVQGSELCLYYPWIKESKKGLEIAVQKLVEQITEKQLLEKSKSFLELTNILQDSRAKEALTQQVLQIVELLKKNFAQLEKTVELFLESSSSLPEFVACT
ncbi:MAG: hypothetical protein JSW11_16170 [Candidatus Heimdallarchaeota archaeon]|nr:MAG: hypothetical protein JSW11_16170 [Candidatus Heimdallarchaeota archaeon]